jgi:hypothetical protein
MINRISICGWIDRGPVFTKASNGCVMDFRLRWDPPSPKCCGLDATSPRAISVVGTGQKGHQFQDAETGDMVSVIGWLRNRFPQDWDLHTPELVIEPMSIQRLGKLTAELGATALRHSVTIAGSVAREPFSFQRDGRRCFNLHLENRSLRRNPWDSSQKRLGQITVFGWEFRSPNLSVYEPGQRVAVSGHLRPRSLVTSERFPRAVYEVQAETVHYLGECLMPPKI